MKVLLVGFYGHGNFGDDILFKVVFGFVLRHWPDADVAVQTEADQPQYLQALVGRSLRFVGPGQSGVFDLILHGGGGNFFDFSEGSWIDGYLNQVARRVGYRRFADARALVRQWLGRASVRGGLRVGVGLGVGEYAADSRRLRWHLETLHDFDWLAVRDAKSARGLRSLQVGTPIDVSTDLAFATALWLPEVKPVSSASGRIVAVLRSWSLQDGIELQRRTIETLDRHAGDVVYLLLDEMGDAAVREFLGGRSVVVYRAGHFEAVLDLMRGATAIISARAHGGIVGAILGKPTVLAPIEPKLHAIHQMLPKSTILLKNASPKGLEASLQQALQLDPVLARSEVDANLKQIECTLTELGAFLRERFAQQLDTGG